MKRLYCLAIMLLSLFCMIGCGDGKKYSHGEEIYKPSHAKGFSIYATDGESTIIEVRNPWQGAENVTTEFFISRAGETAPKGFEGDIISTPIQSVVCLSSSHIAFLDILGEAHNIKGVSGARYISNETIQDGYRNGDVRDVGYDTGLNYEALAEIDPDIVFIYGIGGENTAVTSKLREMGIPVIYIAEYLEETPLGKSEWIAVFGELMDRQEEADEIFTAISERYELLRDVAANFEQHPVVMMNAPYRDVWFVPGDRSYMVQLIRDASGVYACQGEDTSASRPISGEAAYMAADSSDVWINPNQATTLAEVAAENPKFAGIGPMLSGRVYNATKRRTHGGGSDLWESGAVRADQVLEDMMLILHPDWQQKTGLETYYFEQLK